MYYFYYTKVSFIAITSYRPSACYYYYSLSFSRKGLDFIEVRGVKILEKTGWAF
jgi:hypothetical protein